MLYVYIVDYIQKVFFNNNIIYFNKILSWTRNQYEDDN